MKLLDNITPQEQDFAQWYQDVVVKGNLIDYGQTKGSMIFKPISYGIWENIQREMNAIFRQLGVQNVYLPLLIPKSYIEREKDHVKGFAPELATVTHVGDKKLDEPFVIRPTSEVLFGELFAKEVHSYNDLPIMYNQWANVLRWEKTTNPFLRNREFLWQEGHTVHATAEEAKVLSRNMIDVYEKFVRDYLAMPVLVGQKTDHEKFAGAVTTYTIEAMMKDGRALQAGTSHFLGQTFAKAFNITFKNAKNEQELAYQTSWGVSTRLIGGLIMTHGDNRGIIIPPMIAPNQVDVLALFASKNPEVAKVARSIYETLSKNYRVRLDDSDKGPGHKAGQSEIEGTPLRIEVGPRDLEQGLVTLVRRDNLEKKQVKLDEVLANTTQTLKDIQNELLKAAETRLKANIVEVSSYDELKIEIENRKFVLAPFGGTAADEERIKAEIGATTRCIPFGIKASSSKGRCIVSGKDTNQFVIFARAY